MTYLRSQSQYGAALGPEREQNVKVIYHAFDKHHAADGLSEPSIAELMHMACSQRPISEKHDAMRLFEHGKKNGNLASRAAIEARQDAAVRRREQILAMPGEITRGLVADTFIVAVSTAGKDLAALWRADLIVRHKRGRCFYYTVKQ